MSTSGSALFPPRATTTDKGHGRLEERAIRATTDINDYLAFPHVGQVFEIHRTRTHLASGKTTEETVQGVTSLTPDRADPARLLQLARGHWAIENRLHWVRDVSYDEDRCRIRKGNGPQVMASIRNLAISLLRLAGVNNIPQAHRACARAGLALAPLICRPISL